MFEDLIAFIRDLYRQPTGTIPLHAPVFKGKEREYVLDTIDSTFVSSVGEYVNRFEKNLAAYTGAARAVATVNGTTALQTALQLVGVKLGDEVITQPFTFVATANAITHTGAEPVFVDVDNDTMGMSPEALEAWLEENVEIKRVQPVNKTTDRRIAAIVPMHTFGHPCRIEEIIQAARQWSIPVVEDAAEAIGSTYKGRHCGTFAEAGMLSFNGNKAITCGGGGAILTNNSDLADRAKHLSTTAKIPHAWEFYHDEAGYNFRMPNINAALGCAQLERLPEILQEKRQIASKYQGYLEKIGLGTFKTEPDGCKSNYWLCALELKDISVRDKLLEELNRAQVMARPAWKLMTQLPMYSHCQTGPLPNAMWLQERIVNLPSGPRTNG